MNNFEDFKNEYFNGDEDKAIRQLAYEGYSYNLEFTKTKDNIKKILDSMDEAAANKYMDYLYEETEKNPERYNQYASLATNLVNLNMTYDEVKNAEINPFKAKLLKSTLKLLIGGSSLLAISIIASNLGGSDTISSFLSYLNAGVIAYTSAEIGANLINYSNFKQAKKQVENNETFKIESESKIR